MPVKKYPILPIDSRWKIVKESGRDKHRSVTYEVECSCANKTRKIVTGASLTNGGSKSCGCLNREIISACRKKYPILPIDSRWKIVKESGRNKHRNVTYEVECSCANKTRKIVIGSHLTNGGSKSCGCLNRESSAFNLKHGVRFTDSLKEYGHLMNLHESIKLLLEEIDDA